ncbi:MAG: helix-turn-helix transcriptional regulator [Bdellovibrionaceae bacterium]|nr:helix-turn-helix transcriptional regulator [Pseudobdellovibrionaceae bacterium]
MKSKEQLGARLKRLRLQRGLSTSELAKSLGVSPSTYREWEYGRAIRGEPYDKLASALGVSLHELVLGEKFVGNDALRLVQGIESDLEKLKREIMKAV